MKKIPTLFVREYENHKVVGITDKVTEGCESVLKGECVPTVKYDGSCCAIINGVFYKRYDAKKGKRPPEGAIPCCEPDPVTGHHPHWVKVDPNNPADKWFVEAYNNCPWAHDKEGTYEAVGLHFQGNPYKYNVDTLVRHGSVKPLDFPKKPTFDNIKKYLEEHTYEGIVFWKNEPICKIKRSDFGLPFPVEEE